MRNDSIRAEADLQRPRNGDNDPASLARRQRPSKCKQDAIAASSAGRLLGGNIMTVILVAFVLAIGKQ